MFRIFLEVLADGLFVGPAVLADHNVRQRLSLVFVCAKSLALRCDLARVLDTSLGADQYVLLSFGS